MRLVRFSQPSFQSVNDPFEAFTQEIDRLFALPNYVAARNQGGSPLRAPAVDVHEDKTNVYVTAELPGLTKEAIEIAFDDDVLTISGERKLEQPVDTSAVTRQERYHGRFERRLAIERNVDSEQIKASYKDGVLTVTLPKKEEAKPRQIPVSFN